MHRNRLTIFIENLPQLLIIHVFTKIFDIDICELFGSGTQLSLALLARFETSYKPVLKWEEF